MKEHQKNADESPTVSRDLKEIAALRESLEEIRDLLSIRDRTRPKYRFVNPYFHKTSAKWQGSTSGC